MGRIVSSEHTFLNAKAATGAGSVLDVSEFRNVIVTIATDGGSDAALTVKCAGAISETAPTFTSAQSVTNMFDYIFMWDYENATGVDGDTGFSVATADDYRVFMVNTEGLKWLNFVVTARTEGEVTVKARLFDNS